MRLTATLDSESLPPEEADRLRRLIAATSFFEQAPRHSRIGGADRFQYEVTVEDGDRIKKVEMDEPSVPEAFRPLLDYLIDSARTRRKIKRS